MPIEHDDVFDIQNCLFVFIDESGDIKFTPKSSYNFYLNGLVCNVESEIIGSLYDIRHKFAPLYESKSNKKLEALHATEDFQVVRNAVFQTLSGLSKESLGFYSVILQKNRMNPAIASADHLYTKASRWLMGSIFHRLDISAYKSIAIFYGGTAVSGRVENAIVRGIKQEISAFFDEKGINVPYRVFSHSSKTHVYLQVCDYISWASAIRLERRQERRPYEAIKKFIRNEFFPFRPPYSTTEYYRYE